MKLSIAEGVYLIALDDEEGRILAAAEKTIVPGIVAACILELSIMKKVGLANGNVNVLDKVGTGNGILDRILNKLVTGAPLTDQVSNLASKFKDIQDGLNTLLAQRGILRKQDTKLFWIPLSEQMDNANYAFEQEIRNTLKAVVFKGTKASPAFIVLFSLIYDCNILSEVFRSRDELIDAEKVAKDIINSPDLNPDLSNALKQLKVYFGN